MAMAQRSLLLTNSAGWRKVVNGALRGAGPTLPLKAGWELRKRQRSKSACTTGCCAASLASSRLNLCRFMPRGFWSRSAFCARHSRHVQSVSVGHCAGCHLHDFSRLAWHEFCHDVTALLLQCHRQVTQPGSKILWKHG